MIRELKKKSCNDIFYAKRTFDSQLLQLHLKRERDFFIPSNHIPKNNHKSLSRTKKSPSLQYVWKKKLFLPSSVKNIKHIINIRFCIKWKWENNYRECNNARISIITKTIKILLRINQLNDISMHISVFLRIIL